MYFYSLFYVFEVEPKHFTLAQSFFWLLASDAGFKRFWLVGFAQIWPLIRAILLCSGVGNTTAQEGDLLCSCGSWHGNYKQTYFDETESFNMTSFGRITWCFFHLVSVTVCLAFSQSGMERYLGVDSSRHSQTKGCGKHPLRTAWKTIDWISLLHKLNIIFMWIPNFLLLEPWKGQDNNQGSLRDLDGLLWS